MRKRCKSLNYKYLLLVNTSSSWKVRETYKMQNNENKYIYIYIGFIYF